MISGQLPNSVELVSLLLTCRVPYRNKRHNNRPSDRCVEREITFPYAHAHTSALCVVLWCRSLVAGLVGWPWPAPTLCVHCRTTPDEWFMNSEGKNCCSLGLLWEKRLWVVSSFSKVVFFFSWLHVSLNENITIYAYIADLHIQMRNTKKEKKLRPLSTLQNCLKFT